MAHKKFSTSTKVLFAFSETEATKKLVAKYGDRLSGLSQSEKYSLIAAIGCYLWGIAEDIELGTKEFNDTETLVTVPHFAINPDLSKSVKQCLVILQNDSTESLAAIIYPLGEYAKEDTRLHK